MIKFSTLALAGAAVLGLTAGASAGVQSAGSLLVFPYYESGRNSASGLDTYVTVTNINLSPDTGTVKVEYVYINGSTCLEFNRTRTLTPGDTLTVNTRTDNPNSTSGYLYVFAKNKTTGAATRITTSTLAMMRRLMPAKKITAQPVPRIISEVPRSGCFRTKPTGAMTIRKATRWIQPPLRPDENIW